MPASFTGEGRGERASERERKTDKLPENVLEFIVEERKLFEN